MPLHRKNERRKRRRAKHDAPRRRRRNESPSKKPAARGVVQRAEAPEDRDGVQDNVQERLNPRTSQARVDEHELQSVRAVEQRSADEDEEEHADERVLPTQDEHGVRGGVRRPKSERSREEQEEQRDREEECGEDRKSTRL